MLGTEMTETDIEHHLGPFGPESVKPHSRTRRAMDGSALLKVYVEIDPEGRRRREADTVGRAVLRGVSAPAVLATGKGEAGSWTVFRMLPGMPCSISAHEAIEEYIGHVLDVSGRLHQPAVDFTPGFGWERRQAGPVSQHQFLLDQLTSRCRRRPWWAVLEGFLYPLDSQPVVYLHGDLKPEHLLVDGGLLHVVDWEASACGPAVVDYTDVVFHLVRDLLYAGVPPERVPVDLLTAMPFSGPVLAWRLLLWLDRRRPHDIDLLSTHDVSRLAAEEQPTAAYRALARSVAVLRAAGVPR
ncbi:aminoglycoside phosphotransferase family protein [Streptomyces sp. NRRL S-378]|uniref:aminoglycoside phosphotransferase family protein n=1 Tax=Streptomyces sp. NRRL S-378 TaxID=1463904 RepID=UPI001F2C9ACB|nr:aminoglycoside phosphotransferase family protein [Streptomyces sp. NRRL S-378]